MQRIKLDKSFSLKPKAAVRGWVFYAIYAGEEALYSGFSARLQPKLDSLKQRAEIDPTIKEICDEADNIRYKSCAHGLEALAYFKAFLHKEAPRYQYRIQPWQDYVYLALDARRFPFIGIQSNTNDDWQYIGPFRSRFILVDLLDTLSRILKLPQCETGTFPCEKFDNQRCRGWCLALSTSQESEHEHSLDKLESLLKEAFMHPNNGIYEMVQSQRDSYFENLEFAKADLLDDELRLLGDYRDWLNFLYLAKELDYEDETYAVSKGQLQAANLEGKSYNFMIDTPDYRQNEALAVPLIKVDEMKIIFDYIREKSNA